MEAARLLRPERFNKSVSDPNARGMDLLEEVV